MRLWRISNYADLSGIGGLRYSARWHTKGRPIFYSAEHPAGALTEFLVHLDREDMPDSFQLLTIELDEDVSIERIEATELSAEWIADERITRQVGDDWLARGASPLLRVPSAIVPEAYNMLINPRHPEAVRMRITGTARVPLDDRLKR